MKNNTIFVGGLSGSGKTHWLLHSRHYWQTQKIACGFFKPFETGASEKKAQDKLSDGELYLSQEKHTIGGLSAILLWLMTLDKDNFLWNQLELKALSDAGFQT